MIARNFKQVNYTGESDIILELEKSLAQLHYAL